MILALAVAAYVGFYLVWTLHNYDNFGTFGFDLGIHDQAAWLISQGRSPFITISGANYFGDHLSWMMVGIAPVYLLFPSAKVLLTLQALALGLAAVPLFMVAREKLRSEWLASGVGLAYLLNPYVGWMNLEQFHPDVLEVPLAFLVFWFLLRRRWLGFFVALALMLLVKEDVPLFVLGLGAWVALRHHRRMGFYTLALGSVFLFLNFRILLPALSGTGSLAGYVSAHTCRIPFGGVGGFIHTVLTKPWRVMVAAFGPGRPLYLLQVFTPVGYLAFLSPSSLAPVALPLAANLLSTFSYQHTIDHHYGTLVVPVLVVAAVLGITRASFRLRPIVVGLMVGTAVLSLWLWGPVPGSRHPGPWDTASPAYRGAVKEAIGLIPPEATISVDFHLVTKLDHRLEVYEFPNPWLLTNWAGSGKSNMSLPDRAAQVTYVLVPRDLKAREKAVYDRLLASGEFQVIFDRENVVLLECYPSREGKR